MKKILMATSLATIITACCSCGSNRAATSGTPTEATASATVVGYSDSHIPKAVAYKTNGNYNDKVPVTLDATRTRLVSFPAPSDISENSTPVALAYGFLLDRRGISYNSAFLDITYKEYAALKQVPSPKELMKMIIPDARVIETVRLPMTLQEALADIPAVDAILKSDISSQAEEVPLRQ